MAERGLEVESHNKPCTLCGTPRPVLVRCQVDESGKWHFVCPGKCWTSVSGGEIDAKGHKQEYPYYRYGGMWKNRHADGPLNAKKPKKDRKKDKNKQKHNTNNSKISNGSGDDADESLDEDGHEASIGKKLTQESRETNH